MLFNDNHNTFDHVIDCLITTCGHDALQAEQCAMVVHFKGKCTVKSGSYDELAPIHKSLTEKDLTVRIESLNCFHAEAWDSIEHDGGRLQFGGVCPQSPSLLQRLGQLHYPTTGTAITVLRSRWLTGTTTAGLI